MQRNNSQQKLIEYCLKATSITRFNNIKLCLYFASGNDADGLCLYYDHNHNRGFSSLYREGNRVYLTQQQIDLMYGTEIFSTCLSDGEIQDWQHKLSDHIAKKRKQIDSPSKLNLLDQARILQDPKNFLALAAKEPDVDSLQFMLQNFSLSILHYALKKPLNDKTPIDLAAIHQPHTNFLMLLNTLGRDYLQPYLNDIHDQNRPNVLHYAAQYQSREGFAKLYEPLSWETLAKFALTKDESGLTFFEILLLKYNDKEALRYLQNIHENTVSNICNYCPDYLVDKIVTDDSWLEFGFKLSKSQHLFLGKILAKVKELNWANPRLILELIGRYTIDQETKALRQWLEDNSVSLKTQYEVRQYKILRKNIDSKDETTNANFTSSKNTVISCTNPQINQILWRDGFYSVEDVQKAYGYFRTTKKQDAISIIDKLVAARMTYTGVNHSYEKYQAFLSEKRQNRFHLALMKYTPEEITALIEALQPPTLENEIAKIDANGTTALKIAARRLDAKTFALLCKKVSTEALRQALIITNKNGENAFHDIAVYQNSANFIYILNHVYSRDTRDELQNVIKQPNLSQTAPIHLAAYYQDGAALSSLFVSFRGALLQILTLQDSNDNSALLIAMAKHAEIDIRILIDAITFEPAILKTITSVMKLANKDGNTLLEQAFINQSPAIVLRLISLIVEHTHDGYYLDLCNILNTAFKKEHVKLRFMHSLLTESTWHSNMNVMKAIFIASGNLFMPYLAQANFYGIKIPKNIRTTIQTMNHLIQPLIIDSSPTAQLFYGSLYSPAATLGENAANSPLAVYTSQKTLLNLDDPRFLEILLKEGVMSLSDYIELRKVSLKYQGLNATLDRLVHANCLLTGSYQPLSAESESYISLTYVRKLIRHDNALLQWIPQATWTKTLNQLNRQELKNDNLEEKHYTHEFCHADGTIKPYEEIRPEERNLRPIQNARAIELVDGLNTNVINHDEKAAPHVGILYKRSNCLVTARFTHEIEIKDQEWLGTQEQAEAYAKRIKPFHCTNRETFITTMKNTPYKVNLVLANLCPEAAQAIILADSSLGGRIYAMTMARDFKATFNRVLPIVGFQYIYRMIGIYLPEQQAADFIELTQGIKLDPFTEHEAKYRLFALRDDIANHKQWIDKGLFSTKKKEAMPAEAKEIVNLIDNEEKAPLSFWSKTATKVKQQLKTLSANKNDNEVFYATERKKYFP